MSPRWMGALLALGAAATATAQQPTEPKPAQASEPAPTTHQLVAGKQYKAGGWHRMWFGDGYRDLWTTPIRVEVLDLERLGLLPQKKGGGKETKSLRFKDPDGRVWSFRSVDKDPHKVIEGPLQGLGVAEGVAQDQISASVPAGVLVVDPLADAVGVLHVSHRLYVMPDDPRLGEFRKEFAGMLGTLEERPSVEAPVTAVLAGYDELIDTDELIKRLDASSSDRMDARAYLRARLFDAVIGDYDRHDDQWDWARNRETRRFEPVPKDRDLAFVRFEGFAASVVRLGIPRLVKFEEDYPKPMGLGWQSRFLDRRFLPELDWFAWAEVGDELQQRLTPTVIDAAVARLPGPYNQRAGGLMAERLKHRVAELPVYSRQFYDMLAREVDVHATDEADTVQISHLHDGSVEVAIAGPQGRYFDRVFRPAETKDLRIYAKGGDDRVISEGRDSPGLTVRVAGGDGNDSLDDSGGGHTRFYDSSGENQVARGPGTHVNTHKYTQKYESDGDPMRDWGSGNRVVPYVASDRAYGVLLGLNFQHLGYGFRKHPWGTMNSLRLAYSTSLHTGDVRYEIMTRRSDSKARFDLVAIGATGLDVINYYGFGNETKAVAPEAFHDVRQFQYIFAPSYRLDITGVDISVGPVVKYSTMQDQAAHLIGVQQPYGSGKFGQAGARVGFGISHFDRLLEKPAGLLLATQGNYYAPTWDTTEGFGEVHGTLAAYARAPMPLRPTLAVRVGGRQTFGKYPVNEAAFIGGRDSLRGLPPQRYAGDASAYGGAELRFLLLGRERGFLSRFGVFGLAEGGRVFLAGEDSTKWHTSYGGGFWLALFQPKNCLSLSIARSEGDQRIYLDVGRMF